MPNNVAWIGLSDQANKGVFVWVNGARASFGDRSLWNLTSLRNALDPVGSPFNDCCLAFFSSSHPLATPRLCGDLFHAICEKRIEL